MNLQEIMESNAKVLMKAQRTQKALEEEVLKGTDLSSDVTSITNAELFFSLIGTKSAQSKAPATEKFLANKLGYKKIKASENRGDFRTKEEEYIELKTSFTNQIETLNMRQIRLWQDVDYYYCMYVDEDDIDSSCVYVLTHEQMAKEVELMGGYTHGTVAANINNVNCEYSVTVQVKNLSNANTIRWNENYKSKELFDLIFK